MMFSRVLIWDWKNTSVDLIISLLNPCSVLESHFALVTLPVSFEEEGSASTDNFRASTHYMVWPCSHLVRAESSIHLNGDQGKTFTGCEEQSPAKCSQPTHQLAEQERQFTHSNGLSSLFLIIFGHTCWCQTHYSASHGSSTHLALCLGFSRRCGKQLRERTACICAHVQK